MQKSGAVLVTAISTAFVLWMIPQFIAAPRRENPLAEFVLLALIASPAAVIAVVGSLYALGKPDSEALNLARSGCAGALLVGGLGFLLGFIGPILLTPESNQGPLLGIFVTGPIGMVLGAAGGMLWATLRGRR
jgi:hypothetical protein